MNHPCTPFVDRNSGLTFYMRMGNPTADHILQHGIFEYSLISWCKQFLSADKILVDIGAHMGTYSLCLKDYCREAHAFECQRSTYGCLTSGVEANEATNVKTYNIALGCKEGKEILHKVSEDGGGSTLSAQFPGKMGMMVKEVEMVALRTLDSFDLKEVGLIKIDVEGWELEVILGSLQTLRNSNYPPILFEAWPDDWYRAKREAVISVLEALEYKIHSVAGYNNMYLASDHPRHKSN